MPSSTTSAAIAAATKSSHGPLHIDASSGECQLLGPFALLVQLALGGLALLSLVYKRWRERPQRPLKIWFFDVSKQVFGSVLVHISNVFLSMLTSGRFTVKLAPESVQRLMVRIDSYAPNPCSFYLLNLAIDTTLGIPILIVLLRVCTAIVALTPMGKPAESIQSGHYGTPPKSSWWLKQSIIYFSGLFGMKVCVYIIFIMMPWISQVGDWALRWTEGNEKLQIAFVMMIFPLIMNAIQYYIIDSFIKKQTSDDELMPDEDSDAGITVYDGQRRHLTSADDDSEDERPVQSAKEARRARVNIQEEYDPDVDGDAPTIIGSAASSSSRQASRSKVISKDLLPNE